MKSEAEYFAFVEGSVPTCSQSQGARVGTQKANENNTVPSVPSVPTENDSDRAAVTALVGPDVAAFEERAALAEHDGGQSRQDAETLAAREQGFEDAADLHHRAVERWAAEVDRLAALGAIGPEGAEAIRRAQAFIGEGWALQAARLGWDELDLFGVCPRAPWARLDRKGAAFRGAVQAVTRDAVIYVGGLRRYRANINNDGGAVPVWALAQHEPHENGGDAA